MINYSDISENLYEINTSYGINLSITGMKTSHYIIMRSWALALTPVSLMHSSVVLLTSGVEIISMIKYVSDDATPKIIIKKEC